MSKYFSLLTVVLSSIFCAHAQVYNFKTYSRDQGFPDGEVNALWQDKRGMLWIGTSNGLARFDSHHFFFYGEGDGLLNNHINAIYEDASGNLWFGTQQGAYIYNGRNFQRFKQLTDENITALLSDASGNLWLGTKNKGLYKYDGKSVVSFKATRKGVLDRTINCLFLDHQSNLWIGSPDGVAKFNAHQFNFFTREDGLPSNVINNITEDPSGNVWFATDAGLAQLKGNNFINHTDGEHKEVHAAMADNKNNIWYGLSAGVGKYDGKRFLHYNITDRQANNPVLCTYKDHEGNLWFGTSHGLSKLDSERLTLFSQNSEMGNRIYSIIETLNGNIICGTSLGGTTVFDGQHYSLFDKREGFTSSVVQCLYYAGDSSLWIGTQDDGIYKFGKTNTYHYTREDGLPINNITGFAVDGNENMWITSADSGVVVATTANDSLRVIKRFTTKNGLPGNRLNAIVYNRETIWLGTADAGLIKIHNEEIDTTINHASNLSRAVIHSIITDSLQHLYAATSKGIMIYDGKKNQRITTEQGLSSNNIYSLVIDHQRNLWAGTEQGVDMIPLTENLTAENIRHFGADEGFKGMEVYRNASCIDRKGNIWFGTINGLVKYSPGDDIQLHSLPKINITGIKLFFDNIENTPYGDSVTAWFPVPLHLELPYDQNNLTFSFAGVYHHNPNAVRYKWFLEGFSKTWSPALSDQQAVFSNLPPGEYTFKVIACNENNIWNDEPAAFNFSITPPIWQRWWFRAVMFCALVLLIWMVFYIRLKRIETKNKIIQERLEMEKSILELEQEAARLQMNPHFIFNCLNSIQGFISTNDPFKAKKYLAKFARLMRLILENAREEFIPLENEINMLENYLELEKLTMSQPFEFSITVDEFIDPEKIQIPPMMIQPFAENAVVHGLKKKEGSGSISIHFKVGGELLMCTIRDNGIGRKQAALIRTQTSQHKSAAIPITEKRLEQYGFYKKVNAGIQITDLVSDGKPVGTEVTVSTPYEAF